MSHRHTTGPRLSPWTYPRFHPGPEQDAALASRHGSAPAPRRSLTPAPCVRRCLHDPPKVCHLWTLPRQKKNDHSFPGGMIIFSFIGFALSLNCLYIIIRGKKRQGSFCGQIAISHELRKSFSSFWCRNATDMIRWH